MFLILLCLRFDECWFRCKMCLEMLLRSSDIRQFIPWVSRIRAASSLYAQSRLNIERSTGIKAVRSL